MSISENIKQLRDLYDLSQKDLAKIAGVTDKAVSSWETGSKEPRMGAIEKIANHFGLKKSNIIEDGGLEHFNKVSHYNNSVILPTLTQKDERSIQKRLESVLNDLMPGNSAIAYYDGEEPMSDEDKELLRISLENTMRLAKQMAKQKFTPKKYRK